MLTDFYQERVRRQANLANDTKSATVTADTLSKINKLLTEAGVQLCQSKGDSCQSGPQGPQVHQDRGERKETEEEEERKEIEVLWDYQEKAASKAKWEL